ncbi:MAG: hypothetical protein JNK99_02615 [Candidatus Accumulibacter sp.]|nr:hypothetical protein [Accumulibacter sp.]MBL8393631.1 hypothetical protein [Accumulibacter sp.]
MGKRVAEPSGGQGESENELPGSGGKKGKRGGVPAPARSAFVQRFN